ncbi:MAG: 4Fe-4S double cluster binding domain-containing protein [Thermodesulfobacteriota bacterium]
MQKIAHWGAAGLRGFSTPKDAEGREFPFALSWLVPVNPQVMAQVQQGPTQAYADEYDRVNHRINELASMLAAEIRDRGFRARPLAASVRSDPVNIKGDFPHKTAATRAGLGWIGRHCQLVTHKWGSWVRLGTVFTDLDLPPGKPAQRSFCGRCRRCVEACPAGALSGALWSPGLPREDILNVRACDRWKKENYSQLHGGHVCGICSAVCPYGLKLLKKSASTGRKAGSTGNLLTLGAQSVP